MLNPLIDYELEMAHQHQAQLRRNAALWDLARVRARSLLEPGAITAQSRPAVLLSLLAVGQFVVVLDFSIVTIALPAIQTQFGLTPDDLQWVVSAYAVTFAGCLLLGGRLADGFDPKRVFLAGLALFTVASLAGGLAPSAPLVWLARGLQGLGAGILSPGGLALISSLFPAGAQRQRALGVFGTVMAVGFTAGVLLGGVLTSLAGWRWIFFVNVPIGTLALLGGARLLPTQPVRSGRWRLDIAGALLGTAAMAALVASLARTAQPNGGWQQAEVLAVIAAVLLVAFIAAERAAVDPLVPFGIFRCVGLTGANVVAALTLAIGSALAFTLTLVVQGFLGHSAMATGLIFLPAGIGGLVGGALAGRVIGLAGVRSTALAGLLVLASGTVIVLELGLGGSLGWLAGGYAIAGVGIVGLVVTTTIAATTGPGAARHGLAAGLLTTSQQLGAAVGPALAAVLAAPATLAAYSTSLSADLLLMVGAAVIAVVTLGTPKFAVEAEIERRSSAA